MGRAERTGPDPEEKAQGPLGSGHRWGWGTFSLAPGTDRGGPGAAPEERPLGATSSRCWKWPGTLGPDERSSLRPSPDPPSGFHQPVSSTQAPPSSWKGNAEANTLGWAHPKRNSTQTSCSHWGVWHLPSATLRKLLRMCAGNGRQDTEEAKGACEAAAGSLQGSADRLRPTGFTAVSGGLPC